jgi:hypothetical protein
MAKRSRVWPVLKWGGTAFSALTLVVIALSGNGEMAWSTGYDSWWDRWGLTMGLTMGAVIVQYNYGVPSMSPNWRSSVPRGFRARYHGPLFAYRFLKQGYHRGYIRQYVWFHVEGDRGNQRKGGGPSGPSYWLIAIPLWFPLLLALIPTVYLWRTDRRRLPGFCKKCGYNLTGNETGKCPECGTEAPISRPAGKGTS